MDNTSELKRSILGAIRRESSSIRATLAMDLESQVTAPVNAHAASVEPGFDATFATGYSGTETTVPFEWDISLWGSSDVWTGS
jgi:hypothetical protein